jgi:hypothetical protein
MCKNGNHVQFLSYKKLLDTQNVAQEYTTSNNSKNDSSNSRKAPTAEGMGAVYKTQNASYSVKSGYTFKSTIQTFLSKVSKNLLIQLHDYFSFLCGLIFISTGGLSWGSKGDPQVEDAYMEEPQFCKFLRQVPCR